jgi:hypothetical protein
VNPLWCAFFPGSRLRNPRVQQTAGLVLYKTGVASHLTSGMQGLCKAMPVFQIRQNNKTNRDLQTAVIVLLFVVF